MKANPTSILRLFLVLGCLLAAQAVTANDPDRPNILWLTSEDNGPFLGCYGDDYAITPNLDRLADRGILYTNAFATSPVCAPARFTLATGVYVNTAGTEHMRSKNPIPGHIRFLSSYLREAGYYCTNNRKEDYNLAEKPADAWDESSDTATYRNRKPDQPFFHIQNTTTSHESRLHRGTPPEWHDPAEAPVPPYHPDVPEVRETWAVYYDYVTRMDAEIGEHLAQLEADGLADNTIVFYYSDHGGAVARSKRFLFESGMRVPLIVHFPEKWRHLAPQAAGTRADRLVTFIDLPPTVLSLAEAPIPDHMQGHAFAGPFEDEPRAYAYGLRGRMDERADRSRTVRDKRFRYTRNWMPFRPWGQYIEYLWRAPATMAWHEAYIQGETNEVQSRFFETPKPAEELYDVMADPHNVNNLADDPAYRRVLERMRGALDDWILYNHDSGLLPEGEMLIRSRERGQTIYEMVRSPDYPVEDLLHAANLASTAELQDLKEILELTEHPDSGVRFWAATGLINLDYDNVPVRSVLKRLLKDSSASVSLVAAEALYRRGERESIVDAYKNGLRHPEMMVRVHAVNSLTLTDRDFAKRFVDVVQDHIRNPTQRDYDTRAFLYFLQRFDPST